MRTLFRNLAIVLIGLLPGCGLFAPRDSEPPIASQARTDPLGFLKLLSGTTISFTPPIDYPDLFGAGMTYQQLNRLTVAKSALISRLNEIEGQYPRIKVSWTRAGTPSTFSTTDTNDLFGVTYAVFLDTMAQTASPEFTGTSDFKLWYSNAWTIAGWNDRPDSTTNGLSFFSPR
jgi:hypothetical protein